uniref:Putative conserved plasma membrane protein n=1 Tax=Corethrella appendiculata TaxID=1370023 RepID=U5ENV7_9DIPT
MIKTILYNFGLVFLFLEVTSALKITNLNVPSAYILDDTSDELEPLVLDCEYEIDDSGSGFVLKWLLNDFPIYQWIPSKKPHVMQSFKGRVDTEYSVSDDRLHKFSSLSIIKPELNMTGNYACSVQTYFEHDKQSKHLVIISPEREFNMSSTKENNGSTVISCSVRDIYPEPDLILLLDDTEIDDIEPQIVKNENGFFDISLTHALEPDQSEASIKCKLTILNTNYTKIRDEMYHGNANSIQLISIFFLTILSLLAQRFLH